MDRADPPKLQLAVDVLSLDEALRAAESVYPHFDILEVGTPLIFEEGLRAVQAMKERFPRKLCLADLKIMDAGSIEGRSGFRAGADIVTVLGAADDRTIADALATAQELNREVMVDLINVPDPAERAVKLADLGVPLLCVHTAHDASDQESLFRDFRAVRSAVSCRLAIAGGLDIRSARAAAALGADTVVVGGGILRQPDPRSVAEEIMKQVKGEPK